MVRKLQWSVLCLLVLGCAAVAVWAGTKLRAGSDPMPLVRKAPEEVRKPNAEPAPSVTLGETTISYVGREADKMPPPSPPPAGEAVVPSSTPTRGIGIPPKPDFPPPGVDVAAAPPPPGPPVSSEVPSLPKSPEADPLVSPPPSPPPPGVAGLPAAAPIVQASGTAPSPSPPTTADSATPAPVPDSSAAPDNIFKALSGRGTASGTSSHLEATPVAPLTAPVPTPAKLAPIASPWDLKVKIVDGRTVLEARNGDKVQLQIECQHLTLQTPDGNLHAEGNVKVTGPELDGSCEQLTIAWQSDNVVLEGKVRLKCPREGQEIELAAERLSVKLNGTKAPKASAKPAVDESSDRARPSTSY